MPRTRAYCFTLNDYTEDHINQLLELEASYMVFGKEEAPTTGTKHLQGYVCFPNGKTLSAVKKLIGINTIHLEPAKGDSKQNYDYCTKSGDFQEFGKRPATQAEKGKKGKAEYEAAWETAIKGNFRQLNPTQIKTWEYIHAKYGHLPQDLDKLQNFWIHGPSGCGKSSTIRKIFKDSYYTKTPSKWWDGYQNEQVVVLDDLDPHHFMIGYYLKIWCDHYVFPAEVKGGMLRIRPKILIVTSQYTIDEVFKSPESDEQTRDALHRRFNVVNYSSHVNNLLLTAKETLTPPEDDPKEELIPAKKLKGATEPTDEHEEDELPDYEEELSELELSTLSNNNQKLLK